MRLRRPALSLAWRRAWRDLGSGIRCDSLRLPTGRVNAGFPAVNPSRSPSNTNPTHISRFQRVGSFGLTDAQPVLGVQPRAGYAWTSRIMRDLHAHGAW